MKRLFFVSIAAAWMGISSICWGISATEFFDQGQACLQERQFSKAVDAFKKALVIDPALGQGNVELGFAYRLQGDYEKAQEAYLKAIELNPDDAGAHLRLGEIYKLLNMEKRAEKEFEKYKNITEQEKE